MLELTRITALLANVNLRTELHGEDREPAADLKFEARVGNDILAHFHPSLKGAFYVRGTDGDLADQGMPDALLVRRFGDQLGPLKWAMEIVGCTLTVHYGVSERSHVVLPEATADSFSIEMQEGGQVDITFRVRTHPDAKQVAILYEAQQQKVEISLEPPSADPDSEMFDEDEIEEEEA